MMGQSSQAYWSWAACGILHCLKLLRLQEEKNNEPLLNWTKYKPFINSDDEKEIVQKIYRENNTGNNDICQS